MTIGSQSTSLLESILDAQATRQAVSVEVLKKAQDTLKLEGQALVQMLEASVPPPADPGLDAYA
jgi:hypothetical protein